MSAADALMAQFEAWWEKDGQFCRAGGGDYEKSFAYEAFVYAASLAVPGEPVGWQHYGSAGRWFQIDEVNYSRGNCPEMWKDARPIYAAPLASPAPTCWCHKCNKGTLVGGFPLSMTQMILCPTCGCKRCPHANDHRNACTDSNEPGQPGSAYPPTPPKEPTA